MVEKEDMELASFLRTHNKYIYKWNNLTEN